MAIVLSPDQERQVEAQLASGRFGSAQEVLDRALAGLSVRPPDPNVLALDIVELFDQVRGMDLDIQPDRSLGRPIDL